MTYSTTNLLYTQGNYQCKKSTKVELLEIIPRDIEWETGECGEFEEGSKLMSKTGQKH